jgi:hypothetical protein
MEKKQKEKNSMLNTFGFDIKDLKSWDSLVKLMNRPEDPSSLSIFRICFGNLEIISNQKIRNRKLRKN